MPKPVRSLVPYAAAAFAVAAAMLLRWLLWPVLGAELAFLFLWPVVMLAAWLGGFGPGLFATLLSAAAALFFLLEPRYTLVVTRPAEYVGLVAFVGLGSATGLL